MRLILGLLLLAATAGRSSDGPIGPLRPQAYVESDPPAWYSPALFTPMPKPQPGDWMVEHPEPPQKFATYVASRPMRPTRARQIIYLSAVGPIPAKDRAQLEVLREFLGLYYMLPVRIGPDMGLEGVTSRERTMGDLKFRQYMAGDIMGKVLVPLLPKDAACLLGVTMEDLYPEESWNYVFGQASFGDRVGVYSLVRFYPAFWGRKDTEESEKLGLKRSLHLLVHETGHMFSVDHCQKYLCVMNGTNSLPEADRQPLHLCPDCLKKFRWNLGFDIVARYEGLRKFYVAHDMKEEADWVGKRIEECRPPAAAKAVPPQSASAPGSTADRKGP